MEVKCLEIRDEMTFLPVICVRPAPVNEEQRYLLRRDGYTGSSDEKCIIMIDAQCRGAAYNPFDWQSATKMNAHSFIEQNWETLKDGDVIDVQFILGRSAAKMVSERVTHPL